MRWLSLAAGTSAVCGLLRHLRIVPPLGQFPGLSQLAVFGSLPIPLLVFHVVNLSVSHRFSGDVSLRAFLLEYHWLDLAAIALHVASLIRWRCAVTDIREGFLRRGATQDFLNSCTDFTSVNYRGLFLARHLPLGPVVVHVLGHGVRRHSNIPYNREFDRCKLDVWVNDDIIVGKKRPVVVFVHGGAYVGGSKSLNSGVGILWMLARQGFCCVAINYRLAPRHSWPLPLEDLARALAWVHTDIDRFGGDNSQVILMGQSAGGHVVATLATLIGARDGELAYRRTRGRAEAVEDVDAAVESKVLHEEVVRGRAVLDLIPPGMHVRACVCFYPVLDPLDAGGLNLRFPFAIGPLGAARGESTLAWFFRRVVLQRALHDTWSPLASLTGFAPPFLVVHGTMDSIVPIESSRSFLSALETARSDALTRLTAESVDPKEAFATGGDGERVTRARNMDLLVEVPGVAHSFDMLTTPATLGVWDGISAWLFRTLGA